MRISPPSYVRTLALGLACVGFLSLPAAAQTATATTDPVGFITLNVAGNGAVSFKSLGLSRQVDYQGNAESITGGNTIIDLDSAWTDDLYNGANGAYYVEITGPTGAAGIGTTYDIQQTSAANQSITVAQTFANGITAGATFRIRKHWTVAGVFGATNGGGLASGDANTADTVRVYGASGSYDTFYYSNVAGDLGWRKVNVGGVDQAGRVIYPDDGLVITRKAATAANVILMGSVKTGQTSSPILTGMNVVANPYAASMTLADSGLYTGDSSTGLAPGGASRADLVQIFNGTTYDSYFYSNSAGVGTGWRKAGGGSVDQASVQIPVGASIIIQRKFAAPFNWVSLQHPATF
jgi:uncharacterized protein (TIGR02597 family)